MTPAEYLPIGAVLLGLTIGSIVGLTGGRRPWGTLPEPLPPPPTRYRRSAANASASLIACDYCGRWGALGQCDGCGAPLPARARQRPNGPPPAPPSREDPGRQIGAIVPIDASCMRRPNLTVYGVIR